MSTKKYWRLLSTKLKTKIVKVSIFKKEIFSLVKFVFFKKKKNNGKSSYFLALTIV